MSAMDPQARGRLARAFLRALHPEGLPREPFDSAGEPVDAREVEELQASLQALVEARLRQIPSAIADRLEFAARRGPAAVREVLQTAIDDALRELANHGDTAATAAAPKNSAMPRATRARRRERRR